MPFHRLRSTITALVVGSLGMLFYCQGARAADWPQFLGPQRNGISAETNLIDTLPAGGPKEVWRVSGGVGMSALVISDGKLMTLYQDNDKQYVVAINAKAGTPLWKTSVAPAYENAMGNGPRGAPAISNGRVFVFTGEGILAALNAADGEILWWRDVVNELRGKVADYGMACSPLVVGNTVVVTAGAPNACVAAYDVESGELVWQAGDGPAGYSSPALLKVGGREQIVAYTGNAVLGLDPKAGEILWRYPYVTNYECNIATPLDVDGKVFISSGENHGSALLALKPQGDRFTVEEDWTSQGPKSVLRNEWQTSILLDGYLYGFDNVGGAGPISHLTCVNAETGERAWQKIRFGKGNLIAADGKLFISTMKGELVLVEATPKAYKELGRTTVIGSTRQAPALANGLLYLRDDSEIVCLDVSGS